MKKTAKNLNKATNNLVAKHMNTFNRSAVMVDRKKEAKKNGFSKGSKFYD